MRRERLVSLQRERKASREDRGFFLESMRSGGALSCREKNDTGPATGVSESDGTLAGRRGRHLAFSAPDLRVLLRDFGAGGI